MKKLKGAYWKDWEKTRMTKTVVNIKSHLKKIIPCNCDEIYKTRGLTAPDCPYCNYGGEIEHLIFDLMSDPTSHLMTAWAVEDRHGNLIGSVYGPFIFSTDESMVKYSSQFGERLVKIEIRRVKGNDRKNRK